MRASPIAKAPTRTVPVFNRTERKVERMTASAHLRLRLMYAALEDGLKIEGDVTFWPSMSPLKAPERVGVLKERQRLLAMPPPERLAELIQLKNEGNVP